MALRFVARSAVRAWEFVYDLSAVGSSRLFSVTISEQCVMSWCGILQNMYFFMIPTWNMDLLESVGELFNVNFLKKEFPADKQFTIRWINLEWWDSQDKKQRRKCQVHTDERLDNIGARLEHTPRKSLEYLAQEIGVYASSARRATHLLKRRPYETTVIHTGFIFVVGFCSHRRWDQSAIDILFWWSVVLLARIHRYAK
jgi:hypothetical protein